ncbi:MAG: helix-hairpin-helix domain-containing protein [Lentisphaeria bacterium]
MKSKSAPKFIWLMLFTALGPSLCAGAFAGDLQVFEEAVIRDARSNDGDSFRVDLGERECILRLYFVDCPETSANSKTNARRVREQLRYFGVDAKQLVGYGRKAKEFTAQALDAPFIVHTSFASAGGRSEEPRYYAFVTTSDGHDLAARLVEHGFARNHGLGRETPGKVKRDDAKAHLNDLEVAAMMKRKGIWAHADADRIVELRAEQRKEEAELEDLRNATGNSDLVANPVNINHATAEQLQQLKGIGPILAKRIEDARPFETIDDLKKVKGIGPKTLKRLRDQVVLTDNTSKTDGDSSKTQ